MRIIATLLALSLSGCGYIETHEARDPLRKNSLIGMAVPDLLASVGKPDSITQTGPDTAILQYNRVDSSTGLKATVTLLGSIELGGGGGCRAIFEVRIREGYVSGVAFSQVYSDQLFSAPYEACAPLIAEPLKNPNGVGVPSGWDGFKTLGLTEGAAEAKTP